LQHTQRSHVLGRLNFFMTDNWFLISVSHIHNWTEPQPILMDQNWNGSVDGSLIWAQLRPAGHQLDCKSAPSDRAGIQETWGAACTATCAATPCRDHHCTPPWRHAKAATTIQSCTYATADTVTPRPPHRVLMSQTAHDVSVFTALSVTFHLAWKLPPLALWCLFSHVMPTVWGPRRTPNATQVSTPGMSRSGRALARQWCQRLQGGCTALHPTTYWDRIDAERTCVHVGMMWNVMGAPDHMQQV